MQPDLSTTVEPNVEGLCLNPELGCVLEILSDLTVTPSSRANVTTKMYGSVDVRSCLGTNAHPTMHCGRKIFWSPQEYLGT